MIEDRKREVKIYRKLLKIIACFCSDQKYQLNNYSFQLKKYGCDMKYRSGIKANTDFERGWFAGYHAAMNDCLKYVQDIENDSEYYLESMDCSTR